MQVAARSPQAVGDTQEVRVEAPSDFVRARLRVVPSTERSPDAKDEKSDEETRAGLRRLAELIRDKRRSIEPLMRKKTEDAAVAPSVSKSENPDAGRREIRADLNSYHLTAFILRWQERQRRHSKSTADIVREELLRRRALAVYRTAVRKPSSAIALSY